MGLVEANNNWSVWTINLTEYNLKNKALSLSIENYF